MPQTRPGRLNRRGKRSELAAQRVDRRVEVSALVQPVWQHVQQKSGYKLLGRPISVVAVASGEAAPVIVDQPPQAGPMPPPVTTFALVVRLLTTKTQTAS